MPWYYAGPEAKPLGPVSAEQLQALCASGTITPETFVIEHTGAGAGNLAWRRYREIFPPTPTLPPVPPVAQPPAAPTPVPGPVPAPGQPAPHPSFPTTGGTLYPAHPTAVPAGYGAMRPTNAWCAWGFALSLIGFCFAIICIGAVPAAVGVVLCIIGLVQVNKNRQEGGVGYAVAGLIFSGVALLITIILLAWAVPQVLKAHGLTVTEQTSNDSE